MMLTLSLFVLLEAQPPPTRFVRPHRCSVFELHPALLSRLGVPLIAGYTQVRAIFASHITPLGIARKLEPNTFRIPPQPRANEPLAAASFNPGM
jgi:hypothetical protein